MNDLKFLKGSAEEYTALEPKVETTFYYTTDDGKLYLGTHELTTEAEVTAAIAKVATHDTDIQQLKTEISTLVGGDEGESIHDMIEKAVQNENTNYIGDKTTLTTDDKTTIVAAINEVDANANAAQAAAEAAKTESKITIEKTTPEGVATRYTIKQNGEVVSNVTIDIPKDMVVESGEVVDITQEQIDEGGDYAGKVKEPGKYIILTISNATKDKLFIKVDDLVDIYKGATDEEKTKEILVTVDNSSREISAIIQDGSITESKLANGAVTSGKIAANAVTSDNIAAGAVTEGKLAESAVTTEKIANGTITKEKLAEGAVGADAIEDGTLTKEKLDETVQASLDKADSALQSTNITEGKTNGTIAVNETDIKVHGLKSLAYMDEDELALTDYAKKTDITEGTVNGAIDVAGQSVAVHGLSTMITAGAETVVNEKLSWGTITE